MQAVELPLIDYHRFYDSFKEPQPVVAKNPTSSWIYLTSRYLPLGTPRNNFVLSTDRNGNSIEFARETSRISAVGVGIENWYIPNCNPRNQTLGFYSSVSGLTHSVSVPEGYYETSDGLAAAIVIAMNAAGSGQVFSQLPKPLYPRAHIITANVGNFYFIPDCDMSLKGVSLVGIPIDTTPTTSKQIGPMGLTYTNFVDFHSTALTQYQKMRSITISNRSSLFIRAYFDKVKWGDAAYELTNLENLSFAFRANTVLTSIDIQLYDSWGDLLYIPDYLADIMFVQCTIQAEL